MCNSPAELGLRKCLPLRQRDNATMRQCDSMLKLLWNAKIRKKFSPSESKWSLATLFSVNMTGDNCLALKQRQIVAKVVTRAKLLILLCTYVCTVTLSNASLCPFVVTVKY